MTTKRVMVLGLILATANAWSICPLKSYSLNNLASKARSLEKNFQKLTTCYKDSNIQEPVSDIMTAVRKLSFSMSGLKRPNQATEEDFGESTSEANDPAFFYGDAERLNLGDLQVDVERAMEAFYQLSQINSDQAQNSECAKSANSQNAWIGLIEVFNGIAPMAMASLSKGAPQLTPYLIGAQAVGSVVQSVLKSLQERAARYDMSNANKRNAFIDATCLYHDLALNTFVLDETLNTKGNYYEAILSNVKKKRDNKLSKVHDESKILAVLSKEFRDVSEDLDDFIDFEYAGDSDVIDENDGVIDDGYDDSDDGCDPFWGCDYDQGTGGVSDEYRETYVCSALKRYFNERDYGILRSQRFKVFLSYFRKYLKDTDVRSSLVAYDVNFEIFTDALNGLRYGNVGDCDTTHFVRPLSYLQRQLKKAKEVLKYKEPSTSLPMNSLKKYYSQLKEISELSYEAYLVEEKVGFLNRIQEENIEVDLGEIYLLESSINSQLVKGKKYSYSWLEFNSDRGVQFLHSFRKKYDLYAPKIKNNYNKQKNCQVISKLGRDFRIAKNMRERNILYCKIMYPFVNPVDHAEFSSLCQKHGISEYKFEGPAIKPRKRRRRYFLPIFVGGITPVPVYLGKRAPKSAVFTNLYSRGLKTYENVEKLIKKNQCGNSYDNESLDLD